MKAIFRREFNAYFTSPTGYIFLGMALLLSGWFFSVGNLMTLSTDMSGFFDSLGLIFLFLVPMLTMRLLAEEKRNKTDQILLTAPVSVFQIVFGKYLAALAIFGLSLVIMLIYPLILQFYSTPPIGSILVLYVGFFLLGAALLAVGLFISALTESQITSAIASFAAMLFLWLADLIASLVGNQVLSTVIGWLSVLKRFEEFTLGVLNFSSIVYYISFAAVFVFLTIQVIEKKRWS
jgi:ABC-2 type transport system permease protein